MRTAGRIGLGLAITAVCNTALAGAQEQRGDRPFAVVLGIAQDGGIPQTGDHDHPGWTDTTRARLVSSLGLVGQSGRKWIFDATPDIRRQIYDLHRVAGGASLPDGVFLTHAHIGHYTGLMFLGHESVGAQGVTVYAMPRMAAYLRSDGPWSQLVSYGNIEVRPISERETVTLEDDLSVTAFRVPHREEYSEVVGYRIDGPNRSILFIPDIDSWEDWDSLGVSIEEVLATVDVAYVDGTFYADGEIPGRDMSGFPHPRITESMDRFARLAATEQAKIRFIHLNHTNPALFDPEVRSEIVRRGFAVAEEGEKEAL